MKNKSEYFSYIIDLQNKVKNLDKRFSVIEERLFLLLEKLDDKKPNTEVKNAC